MSMIERGDEVSPQRLLPVLRKFVKAGNNPATVHDLRANLGYWLCTQYFTTTLRPSTEDILEAIKIAEFGGDLDEHDVMAGWYMLQLEDDACYRVVEELPTLERPDDTMIEVTLQRLIAEARKAILNLQGDPELEEDLREVKNNLKDFQQATVTDVRHIWNVCRKYGVPPFMTR